MAKAHFGFYTDCFSACLHHSNDSLQAEIVAIDTVMLIEYLIIDYKRANMSRVINANDISLNYIFDSDFS